MSRTPGLHLPWTKGPHTAHFTDFRDRAREFFFVLIQPEVLAASNPLISDFSWEQVGGMPLTCEEWRAKVKRHGLGTTPGVLNQSWARVLVIFWTGYEVLKWQWLRWCALFNRQWYLMPLSSSSVYSMWSIHHTDSVVHLLCVDPIVQCPSRIPGKERIYRSKIKSEKISRAGEFIGESVSVYVFNFYQTGYTIHFRFLILERIGNVTANLPERKFKLRAQFR